MDCIDKMLAQGKNYSAGQSEAIAGIIVGAVLLFIGLFMISVVSGVLPSNQLESYAYSTATNSSSLSLATSVNNTATVYISRASITGLTPADEKVTATITSLDLSDRTVKVYLNGNLVGTMVALRTVDGVTPRTTTTTFTGVNAVNGANTITYEVQP